MSARPLSNRAPHRSPAPQLRLWDAGVSVRTSTGEELTPEQLERIEALDDLIFDALDGDARALDESVRLYRQAAQDTHPAALDESREQYLQRAEEIVAEHSAQPGGSLARTFAALEILTLVAED